MWNFIWFILAVLSIAVLGAVVVGIYINLNKLRTDVRNSWSYVAVEFERKITLVDNLVEIATRYLGNENPTLKEVVEAQSWLIYEETVGGTGEANHKLTGALEDLFVLVGDHPDLKADTRFEKLKEELDETEYLITEYQHLYNEMAYVYNSKRQTSPTIIVANYFGFEDAQYFEDEGDTADDVDLSFASVKLGEK